METAVVILGKYDNTVIAITNEPTFNRISKEIRKIYNISSKLEAIFQSALQSDTVGIRNKFISNLQNAEKISNSFVDPGLVRAQSSELDRDRIIFAEVCHEIFTQYCDNKTIIDEFVSFQNLDYDLYEKSPRSTASSVDEELMTEIESYAVSRIFDCIALNWWKDSKNGVLLTVSPLKHNLLTKIPIQYKDRDDLPILHSFVPIVGKIDTFNLKIPISIMARILYDLSDTLDYIP